MQKNSASTSLDENRFAVYHHDVRSFYRFSVSDTEPRSDVHPPGDPITVTCAGFCSADQQDSAVEFSRIGEQRRNGVGVVIQ